MNMGIKTRTRINLTDVRISAAARCLKHSSDSPVDADKYLPNHSRQSSTSDRLESIRSVGSLAWDDTTLAWGDQTFNTNER